MYYYIFSIALALLCAAIGGAASAKVHSAFRTYGAMPTRSRMTGYDTARRLLRANDIRSVSVGRVRGALTDHYHPKKGIVNLSETVYGNDSIAAVAVAAHEVGHVVQKERGYPPYRLRTVLVGITNIGSRLALPLVLIGLILDVFVVTAQNSNLGFYIALSGVGLYGLATVFALVPLPVEYNASARAKKMLVEQGILTESELSYASKMLNAAAQTYVAALFTSLLYFLRFFLWVMLMFGSRRRD